jgi:hypothetical protein
MNPVAVKILVLPAMLASFAFNSLLSVKPATPAPKGWDVVEPGPEQVTNKPIFDAPNPWAPAEKNLPSHMLDELMFMGIIKQNGRDVHLYKQADTRKYINIDERGQFYRYDGRGYEPITKKQALDWVKR